MGIADVRKEGWVGCQKVIAEDVFFDCAFRFFHIIINCRVVPIGDKGTEFFIGGFGVDVVRGAVEEDAVELGDEEGINFGFSEDGFKSWLIAMGAGMDVPNESDGSWDTEVVVEQTCSKHAAPSMHGDIRRKVSWYRLLKGSEAHKSVFVDEKR